MNCARLNKIVLSCLHIYNCLSDIVDENTGGGERNKGIQGWFKFCVAPSMCILFSLEMLMISQDKMPHDAEQCRK